ncbi:MAG: peptidylprolyl isomerase [Candidatus Paracaedibacteraceae bacterium]|nr:peptidylprolyl isomerase [Candidatus Paracaedibacteraceae bacterium]
MNRKIISHVAFCLLFASNAAIALPKSKETLKNPPKKTSVVDHILKSSSASIAVEVNKDAITINDIRARLNLILLSAGDNGKQATDEMIQQVKEALVQEKLQRQIAVLIKVTVSKTELDAAVSGIAKENNMTLEQMAEFFKGKGVNIQTLRDRVESNLLWIKSVREGIGGHIAISDREVENEERRLQQNEEKEQFEVAEIVLFVNSPENRAHVQRESMNIHKQLTEGAPFSSVARNFSQSPSGAQGGLIGWIAKDQLPNDVVTLKVGHFSAPILRDNRYIIYFVKDHKMPGQAAASEAKISYLDVKITLPPEISMDDQTRIGSFLEDAPKIQGCKTLIERAKEAKLEVDEMNDVSVAMVPEGIRKFFAASGKGKATEPVRLSETELRLFMLCDQKKPVKKNLPKREEIRMMLKEKRVQEQAMTQFNKFKAQANIVYRTPR